MDISDKKVGIWGFGIVGKSALKHLSQSKNQCQIFDNRSLSDEEVALIESLGATLLKQKNLEQFFKNNNIIVPSPGIDISPYLRKAQFIQELDIFAHHWKKPIIAITGTVGKTTITTFLGKILAKKYKVAVGGNIGTPMLSLLEKQENVDMAILEISSWQLEHVQSFKPHIAIISNIFPNHLDRHKSMNNYINAKLKIIQNQTKQDIAILPVTLRKSIECSKINASIKWIGKTSDKGDHPNLPKGTFKQNWDIILATLDALELPHNLIENLNVSIEHRLEHVGTFDQIDYYNDSKSTTIASTLAAANKFPDKNIILILGGLSKGIDRSAMIEQLPLNVKQILCFGKEAHDLKYFCDKHRINALSFDTLEQIMVYCSQIRAPQDIVLFSPSGASFDLYENYKKRGNHFKEIVTDFNKSVP